MDAVKVEIFFNHWDHNHLLDIMPVYYHMQNYQKPIKQSQENDQNLFCGQNLAYFGPYLAEIFFSTTKTTITC